MPNEVFTQTVIQNVNNISVTVADTKTPIVILFGPPASGKTMVLLRMIRHLEQNNYMVDPDRIFRPTTDKTYQEICTGLSDMAHSQYAPDPTGDVCFMLAKILDMDGNPKFQFLEAPGEHYYSGHASHQFPLYLQQIFGNGAKKIWVFLLEPEWGEDQNERDKYARQIRSAKQYMGPRDSALFLLNKADKYQKWFGSNGRPNKRLFRNAVDSTYPNLINFFTKKGPIFDDEPPVVCFSTGSFVPVNDGDGNVNWVVRDTDKFYCEEFFNVLKKL